jgi:hypothetical protein
MHLASLRTIIVRPMVGCMATAADRLAAISEND